MTAIEEIEVVEDIIRYYKQHTKDIDKSMALSAICMMCEEFCKTNNIDILDLHEIMGNLFKDVNAQLGKYE